MDPRFFAKEREDADLLFKTRELPKSFNCQKYSDYRLTTTPMQNFQVSPNTCNNNTCNIEINLLLSFLTF